MYVLSPLAASLGLSDTSSASSIIVAVENVEPLFVLDENQMSKSVPAVIVSTHATYTLVPDDAILVADGRFDAASVRMVGVAWDDDTVRCVLIHLNHKIQFLDLFVHRFVLF